MNKKIKKDFNDLFDRTTKGILEDESNKVLESSIKRRGYLNTWLDSYVTDIYEGVVRCDFEECKSETEKKRILLANFYYYELIGEWKRDISTIKADKIGFIVLRTLSNKKINDLFVLYSNINKKGRSKKLDDVKGDIEEINKMMKIFFEKINKEWLKIAQNQRKKMSEKKN